MAPSQTAIDQWSWAQTATVIVPVITLIGTIAAATVTYALNQRSARRERWANLFAAALTAVEDYAEMPYRIRRRRNTPDARHDLTDKVSEIQSRLAFHQAWLQVEAPDVAPAYINLVRATKIQAGGQMSRAWQQPVLTTDEQMNLKIRLPRDQIDDARGTCITAMLHALGHKKEAEKGVRLPTANSDSSTNSEG